MYGVAPEYVEPSTFPTSLKLDGLLPAVYTGFKTIVLPLVASDGVGKLIKHVVVVLNTYTFTIPVKVGIG
jgi:hypothetical protein